MPLLTALSPNDDGNFVAAPEMDLRDWFAGQALASFHIVPFDRADTTGWDDFARAAYYLAESMLAARANPDL